MNLIDCGRRLLTHQNWKVMTSIPPQRERSHRTKNKTILSIRWGAAQSRRSISKKTLIAMSLTFTLLTIAFLQVGAKGLAQNKVTYSGEKVKLQTVFKVIEKQTGFAFFYNVRDLEKATPVSVDLKNTPLEEALTVLLKNQPLSFSINGKTIFIKEKPSTTGAINPPVTSAPEPPPPIDIKGRITNEAGEPVVASVIVKGTQIGTTTNADGYFELKGVDDNATLVISGVSIEIREVRVGGKSDLDITAITKVTSLNEVVINKGYYTEKQRTSVSNVGKITARDIEKQPVNNPLLALQARIPGLFITQNNGLPGGGITVRIQGQNSFRNGNDPLYVVDGVPYIQQLISTGVSSDALGNSGGTVNGANVGVGNPLTYINPNDIESIEVLKDADATAIYGSRAANGAILITTKKGRQGERKIDINTQTGWGQVPGKMKMMDTRQYLDMRYEAFQNDGIDWRDPSNDANDLKIYDTTRYTDWQKQLIGGTARYTDINASISGGSESFQYMVGGNYYKETTVFPVDFSDQKGGLNFNLNSGSPKQKFHFQLSGNYLFDDNQLPVSDVTQMAVLLEPVAPPLYNADGTLNWQTNSSGTSTFANPIGEHLTNLYRNKTNNVVSNAVLNYRILPGLDFRNSVGYSFMQTTELVKFFLESVVPEDRPGSERFAQFGYRKIGSWIIEPQLNFNKDLWQGRIDILIGATINQQKQNGYSINASGFRTNAAMTDIRSATTITGRASFDRVYKYNAGFARVNYNWKDKYILNLNARRDGSSRFGPKSQFHNFGSIGGAWIFSQENFFNRSIKFLTLGKIRGNYGTTGNDQIGDYAFMNLFNPTNFQVPYQATGGSAPTGHHNPYLEWEETKKLSVGLDLGFLNDRIVISSTYQRNRSSNQLLSYSLPVSSGFSTVIRNFPATIQNTSWEFSLNSSNLTTKDFSWTSNANFTVPKNKLVAFPNISSTSYASSLVIGEPIFISKVFRFAGVDETTGLYMVLDSSGNATDNPSFSKDRTVIINTSPKFYGGFQNAISYQGFQLDFLLQFVKQLARNYDFDNGNRGPGEFYRGYSNQPQATLDRWRKPGDIANVQMYSSSLLFTSNAIGSNAAYSDASYIRLKNLSLSYNIPQKVIRKINCRNFRVYAQGQNLLTITKYDGLDPESQSINSLPPLRVFTIGLQIGL